MSIKKKLAAIGVAFAVLASAGVAFAYFTHSGSGDGTATVGHSEEILLSSPVVGDLYPDGDDVPVTVTIENQGEGAQFVNVISGVVEDQGDCDGAWFEVDDIDYAATLGQDSNDTADTDVRMVDNGGNQDACQGLTMAITWSSN
jgi:hypothetical protein